MKLSQLYAMENLLRGVFFAWSLSYLPTCRIERYWTLAAGGIGNKFQAIKQIRPSPMKEAA
jgi:hypothetical protein